MRTQPQPHGRAELHAVMFKRIPTAIVLLLALATPAHATGLFLVNHCSGTGNTMSVCSGTQNGDMIIAGVEGNCASLSSSSFNVIRGMTPICNNQNMIVYSRVASSEPASYTITAPDSATVWSMRVYRGQGAWAFGTQGDTAYQDLTANELKAYGVTTGAPNEIYIAYFGWASQPSGGGTSSLTSAPAALGRTDNITAVNGTNYGIFSGDLTQVSAGAVGNQIGTLSNSSGGGSRDYGIGFTLVSTGWSQSFVASSSCTGASGCAVTIPAGTTTNDFMVMCEDSTGIPRRLRAGRTRSRMFTETVTWFLATPITGSLMALTQIPPLARQPPRWPFRPFEALRR
jgi:hypothetical protein